MVPGKIFYHALSRRGSHASDNLRTSIQMLDRGGDRIDIARLNNDSFHAVAHDVAGFAGRDHRQAASGRFVNRLRAALQSRRKNVNRSLIEIILEVALEPEDPNIFAAELFQIWFGFLVNAAEEPEFGILQVEPVPGFEQVVNPFSLNQRAGENGA